MNANIDTDTQRINADLQAALADWQRRAAEWQARAEKAEGDAARLTAELNSLVGRQFKLYMHILDDMPVESGVGVASGLAVAIDALMLYASQEHQRAERAEAEAARLRAALSFCLPRVHLERYMGMTDEVRAANAALRAELEAARAALSAAQTGGTE